MVSDKHSIFAKLRRLSRLNFLSVVRFERYLYAELHMMFEWIMSISFRTLAVISHSSKNTKRYSGCVARLAKHSRRATRLQKKRSFYSFPVFPFQELKCGQALLGVEEGLESNVGYRKIQDTHKIRSYIQTIINILCAALCRL